MFIKFLLLIILVNTTYYFIFHVIVMVIEKHTLEPEKFIDTKK